MRGAVNAITGMETTHHAVFTNFSALTLADQYQLTLDQADLSSQTSFRRGDRLVIDWLGVRVPRKLFCHISYYRQRLAHAFRSQLCDLLTWATDTASFPVTLPMPTASEEYFEYIDTLEAVVQYVRGPRRRPFCMVEIGAGFGYWTLTAHAALEQLLMPDRAKGQMLNESAYSYLLVEIDWAKQAALRSVLTLNGVSERRSEVVHAALGDRDERGGAIQNGNPGWYAVYSCDTVKASKPLQPCLRIKSWPLKHASPSAYP